VNGEIVAEHFAIVGMACRFPGAANLIEFWSNLAGGVESIRSFSEAALLAAGVDPEVVRDPAYVRRAAALDDVESFDAALFGLTAREAELLDPAQRLFLEVAHHALEDAGCDPARFGGAVGVFGGTAGSQYCWLNVRANPDVAAGVGELAILTSTETDYLATRVSYKLGLRGPSLAVLTACSTALVSVHVACGSLRARDCDLALAGASFVQLSHAAGYPHQEGGLESSDGHCRAFDAAADGTVWGTGAGVVALKRLADAVADGDHVYAVIRGSAINNDGTDKAGFSSPSVDGQAAAISRALEAAGVSPGTIDYVEAHGTGTQVGDPIEVEALNRVYRRDPWQPGTCAIGSVKTNIGHLGSAAGAAGLIKVALALHHRAIPPSLHFRRPNPAIDFASGPFFVNSSLRPWDVDGRPRRAGVSSFGIGGTNAHAVLEEAPPPAPSHRGRDWQVLALSAHKPELLDTAAMRLAEHLRRHPEVPLSDVAYTLQVGRAARPWRRAVVCRAEDAAERLTRTDAGAFHAGGPIARPAGLVFLFPGQGAQHVGMGRELYETEEVFRDAVDRCAAHLRADIGLDLRTLLYPAAGVSPATSERLDQTAMTQPAIFTIEFALADLLERWGLVPEAMLGHSIGEYVAACRAGVFSLEAALRLVAARGRLMQGLPPGAMLAVPVEPAELRPLLGGGVAVAAVNGPELCVASGPIPAIEALAGTLAARGIVATRLRTSHAFHSAMMEPILAEFADRVRDAGPLPPRIPFVSNVTGTWITEAEATDPGYWARHLRQPVQFAAGVRELAGRTLVEVGPGQALTGLVRLQPEAGATCVPCLPHQRDGGSEQRAAVEAVGRLWALGTPVAWEPFHDRPRRRTPLPGSPLDRRRYWIDPPRRDAARPAPPDRRSAKLPPDRWFSVPCWRQAPAPLAGPAVTGEGAWLLFEDPAGLAGALALRLTGQGRTVVSVRPAGDLARLGERAFAIDPDRPEHYEDLLRALDADGLRPSAVVHAWSVGPRPAELEIGAGAVERTRRLGFSSLMALSRAWAAGEAGHPLRLLAVTSDAQEVVGGDLLRPGAATVAGVCRVLPAEVSEATCRHLDVALPQSEGRSWERLLDLLVTEVTGPAEDPVVAFRGGRRWVQSYEPVELPAEAGAGLRRGGVYLITGGLGGIGLTLARDLAERLQARLVLTARSRLPDPERWPDRLAEHGRGDRVSQQIRAMREMEAAGAEVLVLCADASDRSAMTGVRAAVQERFGELNGIVHAAGLAGGGLIEVKTAEQAAEVMAPKVAGGAVLAEVFGDLPLDFVSLCSSITAVAGGYGRSDYCGANAFLDALAHASAFGETPVTSVCWDAWLEAGMAVDSGVLTTNGRARRSQGTRSLDHPLLTALEPAAGGSAAEVSGVLAPARHWVLDEHRVAGVPVLPGTACLELARAAFEQVAGPGPVELRDVAFQLPLAIPDSEEREVRVVLEGPPGDLEFRLLSAGPDGAELEHARGGIARVGNVPPPRHDLEAVRRRCSRPPGERGSRLVTWGAHWESLRRLGIGDGESLAFLEACPSVASELRDLPLHPALLDEALAFGDPGQLGQEGTYLPVGYGRLTLRSALPARLYSHLRRRPDQVDGVLAWDVTLMDESGAEIAAIREFLVRRVDEAAMSTQLATAGRPPAPAVPGITLAEGSEVFRRLVASSPGPQVVVSVTDLAGALAAARRHVTASALQEMPEARPAATLPRTLDEPYVPPRGELEQVLADLWSELLGVSPIGAEDDFFKLGGNSLVAIQLFSLVRARLDIRVPMRGLFQAPTVAGLAELVHRTRSGGALEEPELVPVPRGAG
jgi:phthiocerol/phenolphthiocerol synthesis type-I polyketide synthase E